MTCKDCYHYGVCELKNARVNFANGVKDLQADGFKCFKDKSKIIELPCKVGDTVYHLQRTGNIAKRKVECFEINLDGIYFVFDNREKYSIKWKTVFLTKEAAEQALREREQG